MAACIGAPPSRNASMAAHTASITRDTATMAACRRAIDLYIHSIGCDSRAKAPYTATMAAYTATMAAHKRAIDRSRGFYRRNIQYISSLRQRPRETSHATPRYGRFSLMETSAPLLNCRSGGFHPPMACGTTAAGSHRYQKTGHPYSARCSITTQDATSTKAIASAAISTAM